MASRFESMRGGKGMFRCPVCHRPLTKEEGRFVCENRHSFDRAGKSSGGYVNLLLANKKSSKDPGDNALMIAGRTAFLSAGYYQPLSDSLNQTVLSVLDQGKRARVLDAGCGEGYYAQRLTQAAQEQGRAMDFYGVDLSKYGVKASAKRCRNVQQPVECSFGVASIFELPFEDGALDAVYNVFSPIGAQEFARVLRPDGCFIAAYPGTRHLYGLKEVLYDAPYENEDKTFQLPGFVITGRERISYRRTIEGQDVIQGLFMMTPYYYKTPVSGSQRLKTLERLDTELDFWLITYRKTEE